MFFARVGWVLLLVLLVLVLLSVLFLLPLLPLLPLPCPPLRPLQHHAEPSLIPYPSLPHQNNWPSTGAVSATGSSNNRNNRHNRLKRNNMKQAQQEQEEQPATYHILLTTYDLRPTTYRRHCYRPTVAKNTDNKTVAKTIGNYHRGAVAKKYPWQKNTSSAT